jgi:DNA-directed RNA polymerase subunit M/transcription elongation factor TFIIS
VAHFNLDDYETVETRLEKFWAKYPLGRTETKLLKFDGGQYIVWSAIYRDIADSVPFATGLAEETVQGRGVNSTSALENAETSSLGRSLANGGFAAKGKRASAEEMAKVAAKSAAQNAIEEAKAKMANTSKEYVPVAKEDDPWTIREAAPATTVDEAVSIVKDIIGGQTERDIPKCSKCQQPKEMLWKTGFSSKNKKPWGNFSCFACKDVIWYEIKPNGSWGRQENKW